MLLRRRIHRKAALVAVACTALAGSAWAAHAHFADRPDPVTSASARPTGETTGKPTGKPSTTPSESPAPLVPLPDGQAANVPDPGAEILAHQAEVVGKKQREAPVTQFRFAQYNVLGSSHTGPGRERPTWRGGSSRIAASVGVLRDRHIDIASMQEFQRDQQVTFARMAPEYQVFPGLSRSPMDGENSVAWRKDRFELVGATTQSIPYFHGQRRNMPLVLLRDRKTKAEFYVTSYHNPANVYGSGNGPRVQAMNIEIDLANQLMRATGKPLMIAGDMNDRANFFCNVAGRTGMHAANGGSTSGGCRPPPSPWIDWIMGSRTVEFSGYVWDKYPVDVRISDHPIVYTNVKITGKKPQ